MNIEQIRKEAPKGATHYIDDEKGFDYCRIDLEERWLDIWNSRYKCWLPIGYFALGDKYKPLN